MFLGVLSIVLLTNGLVIDPKSSLLGLQFKEFNMEIVYQLLFLLTTYFLVHFVWLAWDNFTIWKLRLTGSNIPYEGAYASETADNKSDVSQTTLYSWWLVQMERIEYDKQNIDMIIEKLASSSIDKDKQKEQELMTLNTNIQSLNTNFIIYHDTLSSARIPASLERFDKCFQYMRTSQSLRWFMLELLMPILVGVYSLYIISPKVF